MKVMSALYNTNMETDLFFKNNSKQSDMLNLCLQKHFIKKGQSFQKDALFIYFFV